MFHCISPMSKLSTTVSKAKACKIARSLAHYHVHACTMRACIVCDRRLQNCQSGIIAGKQSGTWPRRCALLSIADLTAGQSHQIQSGTGAQDQAEPTRCLQACGQGQLWLAGVGTLQLSWWLLSLQWMLVGVMLLSQRLVGALLLLWERSKAPWPGSQSVEGQTSVAPAAHEWLNCPHLHWWGWGWVVGRARRSRPAPGR